MALSFENKIKPIEELQPGNTSFSSKTFATDPASLPKPEPKPLNPIEKTMNFINEFNPAYQIPKMAIEGGLKFGESLGKTAMSKTPSETAVNALSAGSGLATGAMAIPFGTFEAATNLPGLKQTKDVLWNKIPQAIGNQIGNSQRLQSLTNKYPNLPEATGDAMNIGFALTAAKKGGEIKQAATPQGDISLAQKAGNFIDSTLGKATEKIQPLRDSRIIDKRVQDLSDIESGYNSLRKNALYNKDSIGTKRRVASQNIWDGAVDENGVIRTKQPGGASEQYKTIKLDNAEGVIRKNLDRLGESVTPEIVARDLRDAIMRSGLKGNDLKTALNKIPSEVAGLMVYSENGKIPLTAVHDAKVYQNKVVNWQTPPEVGKYRKALANAYKTSVEKNTKYDVEPVNQEIGKVLKDVEFIESLDGKRVKGGRLGKYFAQVTGNIVGAGLGASLGGGIGTAVGTIAGGEVAGRLQGKLMSDSLSGYLSQTEGQSPIIKEAINTGNSPRAMLPAPKAGSHRVEIGSTKPIPLTPKTQSKVDLQRESLMNQNIVKPNINPPNIDISTKTTTPKIKSKVQVVDNPLLSEARKYKSAEEFVKAQGAGESLYRGTTLSEWENIKQGGFSGKQISKMQNRTWLADDIETAQGALKMRGGAGEVVIEFKPSARGKSFQDPNSGYFRADNLGIDDVARVTDKNGKIIYETTTGGKTKSQLTDIWKRANNK